jgi:hypothetical protein
MPRSIQIYVPPDDFEWNRQALESLANVIITDEEAGQRGAKLSIFIRMIAAAYIKDIRSTEALMREIKRITQA